MIKSEKPSPFILIKAQVCSEWDSCNAALVCITDGYVDTWKKWDKAATELQKADNNFTHVAYYEAGSEFLNTYYGDDEYNIVNDIPSDKSWMYVEIEDSEEECGKPEQNLDTYIMKLYGNGHVCFIAYGKNTGEKFYTDTIDIYQL